jgi:hypothetical protein
MNLSTHHQTNYALYHPHFFFISPSFTHILANQLRINAIISTLVISAIIGALKLGSQAKPMWVHM